MKKVIFSTLLGLLLTACRGTPTPTPTVAPSTARPTPTPSPRPSTASTPRPTATPTAIPIPTSRPTASLTVTPTRTPTGTVTALSPTPVDCTPLPEGGFLTIWQNNPDLRSLLGCPTSHHPRVEPAAWEVETAYQPFERGAMIWSSQMGWYLQPVIYVLHGDGTYRRFEDTFDPATDAVSGDLTPPAGRVEPVLGFGKVWRQEPGVRQALGWATAHETPGTGRFQLFLYGSMVWISQTDQTFVFADTVQVFDVPFSQ